MCDPEGTMCPAIKTLLQEQDVTYRSQPRHCAALVLQIANCAANAHAEQYVTYRPFTDFGWKGYDQHQIKTVLLNSGWSCAEKGTIHNGIPLPRTRFIPPR